MAWVCILCYERPTVVEHNPCQVGFSNTVNHCCLSKTTGCHQCGHASAKQSGPILGHSGEDSTVSILSFLITALEVGFSEECGPRNQQT